MPRPGLPGRWVLRRRGPLSASALTGERRARLHRRVRMIVTFTITYNIIEAIVALTAGWDWADPVAALVVAVLAVREGIEAWRGDVESPLEVLEELDEDKTS